MSLSAPLRSQITNTIRFLSADAVQEANSGHPGAPMGLADLALVLWDEFLRFDPNRPDWIARDRFVLSGGHASMLQYSLLHLWGFEVTMDDLKSFRQWGSKTPGHPEVGHTAGVEVTTGPLGQGLANSVGMALAAKMLAARCPVSSEGFQPMNQRVFSICGDGDLMEGLSYEAASMAGHWQLDNLVWLFDDNRITIDGAVDLSFSEDVERRFESLGWRVFHADGHNADEITTALKGAVAEAERPSIVICRTQIGWGSPNKVGTSGVHGAPLGDEELRLTREALGWTSERFHVSPPVRDWFVEAKDRKVEERRDWEAAYGEWRVEQPEAAAALDGLWSGALPDDFQRLLLEAAPDTGATRKISSAVLNEAARHIPGLVGGSADLAGSNGAVIKDGGAVGSPRRSAGDCDFSGRQIHFGIREHAMGAVTNGMLLHGGVRPFSATFLVFSDYMRPAMRLAALSELPNIFAFTHDSIFLGEDGPTHQAVEHHWALRIMPGMTYFRPADGVEVAMAWAWALGEASGPVSFALTRQGVPAIERAEGFDPESVWRGGYVVRAAEDPHVILVGTGSELHLCVEAGAALTEDGFRVRVISMPSVELFEAQPRSYQEALIPMGHRAVVTAEAGTTGPWARITGRGALHIGIDRFGASAPAGVLAEKFGLTSAQVTERVRRFLAEKVGEE